MKKLLLLIAIILISVQNVFALDAVVRRLNDSNGTAMTDLAIANGATVYSEPIGIADNVGFSAVTIVEDKSGGAGNVALSAEYSSNGVTFSPYYTTSGGSLTVDSNIATTLTNVTRKIQFTPRLDRFMRFKLVASADSEVTLDFIYQRQR